MNRKKNKARKEEIQGHNRGEAAKVSPGVVKKTASAAWQLSKTLQDTNISVTSQEVRWRRVCVCVLTRVSVLFLSLEKNHTVYLKYFAVDAVWWY